KDLAGFHDADGGILGHPFDSKQGWGRMDVEAVVSPATSVRYFDNPIVFDNTGETWEITLSPADPGEPMRMMLVWTDAPGHGLGGSTPAWNNDLDLEVEVDGDTYRGNWFGPDGWSVSGGSADGMNNTEGVFLGPTAPASATIRVVASDINSDGIPNEGDATDQDFALVCYNCAEEPGFTVDAIPESQDVCAPDSPVYEITVGQVLGFSDPVTLSTSGEPAGASVDFSVNPVVPPVTSTLTIGDTGAASPGTYTITIEGASSTPSRFAKVELRLFDVPPDVVTPTSPVHGDIDVSLLPTFTWSAAAGATEYALEVARDYAFSEVVIDATAISDTSYAVETPLDDGTEYYWRVAASNVCGTGGVSAVYTFTTRDVPEILLVDDDDNGPDVRSYYTDALDALDYDYDVWDTNNSDIEPDAVDLAAYSIVIWFTGDEYGGGAGPGTTGETALATFLADGNCLFISSQDYHYDRGQTTFMSDYLGAASIINEVGHTTVTGEGTVFAGRGPYALSYPFSNFSDAVSPDGTAELAFSGTGGDAAIAKDNGTYRSTYWGFPFEAVPTATQRNELMDVVVRWCRGPLPDSPLPTDSLTRNRYIAFQPNNGDVEVAFQVELVSSAYFPGASVTKWVDVPDGVGLARLTDSPVTRVWADTPVYVGDCAIVPVATYEVRATEDGERFSDPLVLETTAKPGETAYWCDCVGEMSAGEWLPPNGVTNFDDISAAIMGFQVLEAAPHFSRIDVDGEVPNNVINFSDIYAIVRAFEGYPYPFSNPATCP
ncbi:MAG: hypothetical protein KJ749_15540, partial [Planctomycetes bacterium]|nr:hypothetical protein [Planctomycetota bacterium]